MRIQGHKYNRYGKDSSFGNFLANQFPQEEQPKPQPVADKPKKQKLVAPEPECSLNGNRVLSANRSGSSMGSTGWGHSNLDEMLARLGKK